MTKNKLWIFAGFGLVGVSLSVIYWFYFAEPVPFPTDEQLINEIHEVDSGAAAEVIQDRIHVDERYAIVPFISQRQEYGLSYWIWKHHRWQPLLIDRGGQPKVWKIDPRDPSTYHFVWNISPADRVDSLQFYMIRDRGYLMSDEEETYYPRIQMEWTASLQENSYGVMPLPEDGVWVLDTFLNVKAKQQPNLLFDWLSPAQEDYFGWIARDPSGNEVFPESSMNGHSHYVSNITVDYMMILSEEQLELPDRK